MVVFYIHRADKLVTKNKFFLSFIVAIKGRVLIGKFGNIDYYVFRCPNHGLIHDMEHGYYQGHYYHECEYCGFKCILE